MKQLTESKVYHYRFQSIPFAIQTHINWGERITVEQRKSDCKTVTVLGEDEPDERILLLAAAGYKKPHQEGEPLPVLSGGVVQRVDDENEQQVYEVVVFEVETVA